MRKVHYEVRRLSDDRRLTSHHLLSVCRKYAPNYGWPTRIVRVTTEEVTRVTLPVTRLTRAGK